jgi:hypothetical protein
MKEENIKLNKTNSRFAVLWLVSDYTKKGHVKFKNVFKHGVSHLVSVSVVN